MSREPIQHILANPLHRLYNTWAWITYSYHQICPHRTFNGIQKNNAHKTCAKINQDDEGKNQSLQCTGLLLHRIGLTKFQNLLYNYLYSVYSRYSTYLYCTVHAHVQYLFPSLCILHSNVSNGLNRRIITTTNNK